MSKCFLCNNEANTSEHLLLVKCECKHCGSFAYEKNFVTAYDYYLTSFTKDGAKITKKMQDLIKKGNVCFVDDYDTSTVEGYTLIEFRDILNMCGVDLAHNNTIDSNWKD